MIHHTETDYSMGGYKVNDLSIRNQQFGVPFDIIINYNGKVDLSSRWVYGVKPENYLEDVSIYTIVKNYPRHLLSDAGNNYESNFKDVHIGLVGNFDITVPSNFQLYSLQKVLEVLQRDITSIKDILYHDDEANITCPGRMFFNKSVLGISDSFSKDYLKPDPVILIPEKPFSIPMTILNDNKSDFYVPLPVIVYETILKIDSEHYLLIDDSHFLIVG